MSKILDKMNSHTTKRKKIDISSQEMAKLGSYLQRLRLDLDMSLRRAAQLSRISPAHLCKIEQGDVFKSVGIDVLSRLARTYSIPLSSILEEAGFIEEYTDKLPSFTQYLRQKFNLSPQAIRDLETTKEVVLKKYKVSPDLQSRLF
ncbi:MAG: helix-turn-helix domain-containing protein [Parcubacteria group bacterium]|nr:helix-turn-helix domain-containing protein [Parcubacteria group bacterium]